MLLCLRRWFFRLLQAVKPHVAFAQPGMGPHDRLSQQGRAEGDAAWAFIPGHWRRGNGNAASHRNSTSEVSLDGTECECSIPTSISMQSDAFPPSLAAWTAIRGQTQSRQHMLLSGERARKHGDSLTSSLRTTTTQQQQRAARPQPVIRLPFQLKEISQGSSVPGTSLLLKYNSMLPEGS